MIAGRFASPSKPDYRNKLINLHDTTPQGPADLIPDHYYSSVLADTIKKFGANNTVAMMLGLIPSPPSAALEASETIAICLKCGWESAPTLFPARDLNGHTTVHRKATT